MLKLILFKSRTSVYKVHSHLKLTRRTKYLFILISENTLRGESRKRLGGPD